MDMDAFEDYARQIAAEMGPGWTARRHAEFINCVMVTHTDGRELKLRRMEDGARMIVRGSFPATDYLYRNRELPRLTVPVSFGADVAARQIADEVMPVYVETLARVHACNERQRSAV